MIEYSVECSVECFVRCSVQCSPLLCTSYSIQSKSFAFFQFFLKIISEITIEKQIINSFRFPSESKMFSNHAFFVWMRTKTEFVRKKWIKCVYWLILNINIDIEYKWVNCERIIENRWTRCIVCLSLLIIQNLSDWTKIHSTLRSKVKNKRLTDVWAMTRLKRFKGCPTDCSALHIIHGIVSQLLIESFVGSLWTEPFKPFKPFNPYMSAKNVNLVSDRFECLRKGLMIFGSKAEK